MRYVILTPKNTPTLDPRKLSFPSLDHLHQLVAVGQAFESERDAAAHVRTIYPDALCMPFPVRLGSGQVFLLGVLENCAITTDIAHRGPEIDIPFRMFVYAQADQDYERVQLKRSSPWKSEVWKAPVLYPPGDHREVAIEIRANNIDFPSRVTGRMYRRADQKGGRLVLYAMVGEAEVSIEFLEPIPGELVP